MPNNANIAKNTLYLYFRMIVMMILRLYTSRLILQLLGVEDFGIYNVIGGLVAMVGYINGALSNSTMRYISFALGNPERNDVKQVFNTSLLVHFILALIVVFLIETIGLWFLYHKLVIPPAKLQAAFWVFQCSVVITFLAIVSIPFNALIVSNERMSVFAYFTILDAVIKLIVVLLLHLATENRLVIYGLLMLSTQIIYSGVIVSYCRKCFSESRIARIHNRKLGMEMLRFSGWGVIGCTAAMFNSQGVNILLNLFGGPVLNAARGLAVQVQSIVTNFATNFQMAVNPQIIKTYAKGELENLYLLICRSAKFSFYLLFVISLPLIMSLDKILHWWLTEVPEYTCIFLTLILIVAMIDSISSPLMKAADATGKIKWYHICVGGFLLLMLPVGYFTLKSGAEPYMVFIIQMAFSICALFIRLMLIRNLTGLNIISFIRAVLLPILRVTGLALPLPILMKIATPSESVLTFFSLTALCIISVLISIWCAGLTTPEREFIKRKIRSTLHIAS